MKKKKEVIAFLVKQKNSSFVLQTKKSLETSGFLISVYDTSESLFLSLVSKNPKVVFVSNKYSESTIRNVTSRLKVQFKTKVVSLNEQLEDESKPNLIEKKTKTHENKEDSKWGKVKKKKKSLWGLNTRPGKSTKEKIKKKLWGIKKINNSESGDSFSSKLKNKIIVSSSRSSDKKLAENKIIVSSKSKTSQLEGERPKELERKKSYKKNSVIKVKSNNSNENGKAKKKSVSYKPKENENEIKNNKIVIEKSTKLSGEDKSKHQSDQDKGDDKKKSIPFSEKKNTYLKENITDKDGSKSESKILSDESNKKGLKVEKGISLSQNNKTLPDEGHKEIAKDPTAKYDKSSQVGKRNSGADAAKNKPTKKSPIFDKPGAPLTKNNQPSTFNKKLGGDNIQEPTKERSSNVGQPESSETENGQQVSIDNKKLHKDSNKKSKPNEKIELPNRGDSNPKQEKEINKKKVTADASVVISKKEELIDASVNKKNSSVTAEGLTKILNLKEIKGDHEGTDCFLSSCEISDESGYLIIQTKNIENIEKFIEIQKDKIRIDSILPTDISKFANLEEAFIGTYKFEELTNVYFIRMGNKDSTQKINLDNNYLQPADLSFGDELDFSLFLKLVNCNKMIKYIAPGSSLLENQLKKLTSKNERLHFDEVDKEKVLLYLQLNKIKKEQKL